MFNLKHLLNLTFELHACIWMDVILIKETPKAILVMFDGRKNWLPKAWILRIKKNKDSRAIKIRISQYHWAEKFG
jgi:hypothetical protein